MYPGAASPSIPKQDGDGAGQAGRPYARHAPARLPLLCTRDFFPYVLVTADAGKDRTPSRCFSISYSLMF